MGSIPHILVIDDNREECDLLKEAFLVAEWSVDLESSFRMDDALNRLLAHVRNGTRPDLVLLDIMLSGEKSLPLLTDIRSHDDLRDLPIIVMSSITPPIPIAQQYISHGVLQIITKSGDFSGLMKFVRMLKQFLVGTGDVSAGGSITAPRNSQRTPCD